MDIIKFKKEELGLNKDETCQLYDIWGKKSKDDAETFIFGITAGEVVLLNLQGKRSIRV